MTTTLIIPAAGHGARFGGDTPKQLLPLAGKPVIAWSIAAFAGLVDEAVVAISEEMRAAIAAAISQAEVRFPVTLVPGGSSRLESVHAALAVAAGDRILIHDAVRPLVPRGCIAACLAALDRGPGAVVAQPCAATVKRVQDGLVRETVPRSDLWLAQTPQGFTREAGVAAFARARAERWECSDDAQVLERAGVPVSVVPGDARNLKITTPDDLALAEALMAAVRRR